MPQQPAAAKTSNKAAGKLRTKTGELVEITIAVAAVRPAAVKPAALVALKVVKPAAEASLVAGKPLEAGVGA